MNIFEKLNLINKNTSSSTTITEWDSRDVCSTYELNTTDVSTIQEFIETYDNYTTYKNCFINNVFLSEIASCFYKRKEFINCEFEIKNLLNCSNTLLDYEFKNCTFYIADYDKNLISFNFHKTLENKLYSNNNIIYKMSYVEFLSKKYNNNLNKAPENLLKGISINYTDLSSCTFPKNKNFFRELSDTEIHDLKLPKIDLNEYDTSTVRFSNIVFTEDSKLNLDSMKTGIFGSILPVINFNNIKSDQISLLSFYNCTFNKNTIFPKDIDFFTKCIIKSCKLPTYDYSDYKISKNTFYGCTFTNDSKIPKEFFTSKNIHCLEKIEKIPSSYLEQVIILSDLEKPTDFYNKYLNELSEKSRFLLCKKYNLR